MNFSTPLGLSRAAGVKYTQLVAIISNIERNYRQFTVPKRGGGSRLISTPRPTLKSIQTFLNAEILSKAPAQTSAHAYVTERSILSHATVHVASSDFVKIDISQFFPSISKDDVRKIYSALGYGGDISNLLASLCTLGGSLPQGAPTSPTLSNLRMTSIDESLRGLADALGMKYSRYADDIVISGNGLDRSFLDIATGVIEADGLQVNRAKTYYARNPNKMILTGISISERRVAVPKAFKRAVRKSAYDLLSAEGLTGLFSDGKFQPFKYDQVLGRLAFWSYVEPKAEFPRRYRTMLIDRYKDNVSRST